MDKKSVMILAMIGLVIGAVFFGDQVAGVFRGMSVLEAMKFIVTFILHVVVVTIASWALYTLPEILGPVTKLLKGHRRGQRNKRTEAPKVKTPRLSTDQMLRLYMMEQMNKGNRHDNAPTSVQDDIHLNY